MASARKPSARILTGEKELDATLNKIKLGAANKIVRPAMLRGMRLILKSIKARVPPNLKDAKRAMGSSLKVKGDAAVAKVGAGVGKRKQKTAKQKAAPGRAKGSGVGIGQRNIHWYILGTGQRAHDDGFSTGMMDPQMPDVVRGGFSSSGAAALSAMKAEIRNKLNEMARAR